FLGRSSQKVYSPLNGNSKNFLLKSAHPSEMSLHKDLEFTPSISCGFPPFSPSRAEFQATFIKTHLLFTFLKSIILNTLAVCSFA
ncbi:hypothetical protein CEXT_805141, partial [Caerostris extrusa]